MAGWAPQGSCQTFSGGLGLGLPIHLESLKLKFFFLYFLVGKEKLAMPLTLLSSLLLSTYFSKTVTWTWANVKFYEFALWWDRKVKFLCVSGLGFHVDTHVYCP